MSPSNKRLPQVGRQAAMGSRQQGKVWGRGRLAAWPLSRQAPISPYLARPLHTHHGTHTLSLPTMRRATRRPQEGAEPVASLASLAPRNLAHQDQVAGAAASPTSAPPSPDVAPRSPSLPRPPPPPLPSLPVPPPEPPLEPLCRTRRWTRHQHIISEEEDFGVIFE
jgi:hypothetical protein